MRIISRRRLREFWELHADSEAALRTWFNEVKQATWRTPADVKAQYATASFLAHNRVVFNIKGNDYRLITAIRYDLGIVFIRFIGTHPEYDRIDATTI